MASIAPTFLPDYRLLLHEHRIVRILSNLVPVCLLELVNVAVEKRRIASRFV